MRHIKIILQALCVIICFSLCTTLASAVDNKNNWYSYRSDGSNSGCASAKRSTGNLKWTADVIDGIVSEIVISKQQVAFLTIMSQSGETKLYAIDCRVGFPKWVRTISTTLNHYGTPTPAVDESGNVYVSTVEGRMLAYRINDGKMIWKFIASQGIKDKVKTYTVSSTKIDTSQVYFVANSILYAIDKSSGTQLWKTEVGGQSPHDAPAIDSNGNIYAVTEKGLFAVSKDNGKILWNMHNVGTCYSWGVPLLVGDERICESGGEKVVCINKSSRKVLWNVSFPGAALMHPAVYGEHTIFVIKRAGFEGRLLALDSKSGRVKWAYQPVAYGTDPCVSSDGIIFTINGPNLIAIDGRKHKKLWSVNLHLGFIASSPSIGPDGTVYIANGNGKVYAVK